MKANLAFGILLLTCATVSAMVSSPVSENATPVNLRTNSPGKCKTCIESETPLQQSCNLDIFESCIEEDEPGSKFKEQPFRAHSPQEQIELQAAELTSPIDFFFSNAEIQNCVLIDIRLITYYLGFSPPQPERSIFAFIRNGILRF